MDQLRIADWNVVFDREATARAYSRVTEEEVDCDCCYCRNFRAAAGNSIPESFRSLLDSLGIDFDKPAEICEYGPDRGLVLYGPWWHFVGAVLDGPPDRTSFNTPADPEVFVTRTPCVVPQALQASGPLVQVELMIHLPWVIDEPYPEH